MCIRDRFLWVWRNAVVTVWSAPKFCAECNGRHLRSSHGDYFRARFTFWHFGWISGHKIFWPDPLIKKECRSWIMSHDASWIILHHWWSISWILHDHESLWITNDYAWWSMMDDHPSWMIIHHDGWCMMNQQVTFFFDQGGLLETRTNGKLPYYFLNKKSTNCYWKSTFRNRLFFIANLNAFSRNLHVVIICF